MQLQERQKIFYEMKQLQLLKLNRATYNLILDVSPMVDPENNVLQVLRRSLCPCFGCMLFSCLYIVYVRT